MNSQIKMALVGGLALGGLGFAAETAPAMPMRGPDAGVAHPSDVQQDVLNVRYICGYWSCRWVPRPDWHRRHHRHRWHHWRHS